MESRRKGTVTSLSSIFPSSEARKASQLMHDNISLKQIEIQNLNNFVSDNANLINLVQRLPDELHHHIMVPFGKAAFFPGRLLHTNEFTVLLGEGYYAERTAKQTVDILRRRGKTLDSQIDSLKAMVEDIKAKASFFDKTAEEAEEGLVEIREEYMEEDSVESKLKSDLEITDAPPVSKVNKDPEEVDDEEYARIMSRLDELEKEELEAEEEEEEEEDDDHNEDSTNSDSRNQCHIEKITNVPQPSHADMIELGNLALQPGHRDESSCDKDLMQTRLSKPVETTKPPSILKSGIQSSSKSNSKVAFQLPKPDAGNQMSGSQMSRPMTDSLKAFTGTIVERTDNLPSKPEKQTNQASSSQPTKPMSRFKMQRR